MPFYQNIKSSTPEGQRTLRNLLKLRKQLSREIPEKDLDSNLLIATWNIREFGTSKYGGRRAESYYYIAEIIARFDIIAVQEVRKNLAALKKLMSILGSHYEYIFTDVTEGKAGNEERLTFIFDTRKVRFGGLAGEMVLPPLEHKDPTTGQTIVVPGKQLSRTPFMCGFKAGWTNFVLTTVHILYGKAAAEDPNRVEEIRQLAKSMSKRADGKYEWSENIVLLGDFNIFSPKDSTLKAITDEGFVIPKEIQALTGSNVQKNKFYDQIAFKVHPDRFETSGKAGIFDYYKTVMTVEQEAEYAESMGPAYEKDTKGQPRTNKSCYYKSYWRTFQMSDHLPMWVEVLIDHTDVYLKHKLIPDQEDEDITSAPSKEAKTNSAKKPR